MEHDCANASVATYGEVEFRRSVVPAKERVKKSKSQALEGSAASFPRRRESIYQAGAASYMGPRLRGDDAAPWNSERFSRFADFFTRSKAGTHSILLLQRRKWIPACAGMTLRKCEPAHPTARAEALG